jgi:hypothetical protein
MGARVDLDALGRSLGLSAAGAAAVLGCAERWAADAASDLHQVAAWLETAAPDVHAQAAAAGDQAYRLASCLLRSAQDDAYARARALADVAGAGTPRPGGAS